MSGALQTGCCWIISKLFNTFLTTASQMELCSRPELCDFKGISMSSIFTSNWENIQKFQARKDDIVIATYPKAGWLPVERFLPLCQRGLRGINVVQHYLFCVFVSTRSCRNDLGLLHARSAVFCQEKPRA